MLAAPAALLGASLLRRGPATPRAWAQSPAANRCRAPKPPAHWDRARARVAGAAAADDRCRGASAPLGRPGVVRDAARATARPSAATRDFRRCATRAAGARSTASRPRTATCSPTWPAPPGRARSAAAACWRCRGMTGTLGVLRAARRCAAGSTRRGTSCSPPRARSGRPRARRCALARAPGWGSTCQPQPPAPSASRRLVSVIERPLTKPSEAAICATTSSGTRDVGRDRHHREVGVAPSSWRPTAAAEMLMPCSPRQRADAADHAGHVGVAEQRQVRIVDLEVEALAPGLEQVRAVQLPERRADDAHALVAR